MYSYAKCDSARKFRRKILRNITDIHELTEKVRSTGLLLDKKPARNSTGFADEILGEIEARFLHTPQKSLKRHAQDVGILKSSAALVACYFRSCSANRSELSIEIHVQ
jgi:hypothetical protein